MVIFQYNLYIFGIQPCYNESCYKEVVVYLGLLR